FCLLFQCPDNRGIDFEDSVPFVGCLNNGPGRIPGIGLIQEMIDENDRIVIVPVNLPDRRGDEPCRQRVSLPFEQPLLLFLL
ncbi:MAG TPA: hypothetical protein VLM85_24905, partial [Polyangiaceae bacterium]|nr:hypothetical protein [Polyangiaceae bacterium]